MRASATAGIEFFGTTMRYSEVEQYGAQHRLLRLGDCDFEFDVSEVLFELGTQKYLDVVTDALSEIFLGTTATRFRIAIHPPTARIFKSLRISGDDDESSQENVAFESALMHDEVWTKEDRQIVLAQPPSPSTVSAQAPTLEPILVSELSGPVRQRLYAVTSGIPEASPNVISSTEALLAVVRETASKDDFDGYQLSIGLYPSYTEFTVTRGREWILSQVRSEIERGDVAYFAVHFLGLSGVTMVNDVRVRIYGTGVSQEQLETLGSVFFDRVSFLNPISTVDLETDQFDDEFQFESFVVCLGAAL